jgi:hypothetical protein
VGGTLPGNQETFGWDFWFLLEQDPESGGLAILGRFLAYAKKTLDLFSVLCQVTDSRRLPQIPTITIVQSVLIMLLSRLGSLNGLEQLKGSKSLRDLLGDKLPSADTVPFLIRVAESLRSNPTAWHWSNPAI